MTMFGVGVSTCEGCKVGIAIGHPLLQHSAYRLYVSVIDRMEGCSIIAASLADRRKVYHGSIIGRIIVEFIASSFAK